MLYGDGLSADDIVNALIAKRDNPLILSPQMATP